MKPGSSRTHAKCCKSVVSDANDSGIMKLFIVTSKNQIYSWCNVTIKIEFTLSTLGFPNALLVFHQNFKCHILIRTVQRYGSYGGQHLAVSCLTYKLINFPKLPFHLKKLLFAINQNMVSLLERQLVLFSKSDYN